MYELNKKLGSEVSRNGLMSFFSALDKDRNGTVDVPEFYTFWIWTMVQKSEGNWTALSVLTISLALQSQFLQEWFFKQNITKRKKLNIFYSWAGFFQSLFATLLYHPFLPHVENNQFVEKKSGVSRDISSFAQLFCRRRNKLVGWRSNMPSCLYFIHMWAYYTSSVYYLHCDLLPWLIFRHL